MCVVVQGNVNCGNGQSNNMLLMQVLAQSLTVKKNQSHQDDAHQTGLAVRLAKVFEALRELAPLLGFSVLRRGGRETAAAPVAKRLSNPMICQSSVYWRSVALCRCLLKIFQKLKTGGNQRKYDAVILIRFPHFDKTRR